MIGVVWAGKLVKKMKELSLELFEEQLKWMRENYEMI